MQTDVKILLTIKLEGGPVKNTGNYVNLTEKISGAEPSIHNLKEAEEAKQIIKMNQAAYTYMVDTPVKGINPTNWFQIGKKKRIDAHCKEIAESLRGTVYSVEIIED